jgi:3',5'-cyclic AMP phosphodiesterase CpdA
MVSTKKTFIFLSILLFTTPVWAKSPRAIFTFVQLTDMQMGMIANNKNNDEEIRLYTHAINQVNKLKPNFVVITGDLVNNRTDSNQLKAFKQITSIINKKIPVYIIPGNHDVGSKPTSETMDFYMNNYPTDKFSFTRKNVQLIGINSSLINSVIAAETDQWEWLKKVLTENSNTTRKILFTHHPFFTIDINEKDKYENIPQPKRQEYMELLKANGVVKIFAGHYHNNAIAQHDDIEMITTSAVGKQLGKVKSGFRVVTVYKDSISNKYIELPTNE